MNTQFFPDSNEASHSEAIEPPADIVPVSRPFGYRETVRYLQRSSNECMYRVDNDQIHMLIPAGADSAVVRIDGEQEGYLRIRYIGDGAGTTSAARAAAVRYVREWFDLDTDLAPFYEMAENDTLLREAVHRNYGLRLIGIPDLFEALCWGIIGQQINLTFAYTLKRRFVEQFGTSAEADGQLYWAFPSPERIAALDTADLIPLQLTSKKAEYLIGVARLVAEGKLSKERLLATGDCKAAEKQLVSVRGIGPWTANYVLMRCLRYPSAFPIDDVGLHLALKQLLGLDHKPSKETIERLSVHWAGWEAYATFYLWRVLY